VAYNDIFRLRIHQRLHGQEVLNVLHFVQDDPTPGWGAVQLAEDFRDSMGTLLRARAGSQMAFEFVEVVPIVPYGGGPEIANWPANTLGTSAGNCHTGTLAEVVTIYTSQIGRRHRGRMYLAGGGTTTLASGLWATSQTTATMNLTAAMTSRYITGPAGVSWRMGVWSKLLAGPDPPYPTSAFTRATSLTVRNVVRNQRRRQIGVGR
jgi:hypothetical protein